MKTEELKAQGLTEEQIAFVMAENGKDIGKVQKKLDDMTAERDKEKGRADTAEDTLKKFEGVDVEAIKTELESWKKKAGDAEKEYAAKLADRDFEDLVRETITGANGINPKAIRALLDIDVLKASKNQKADIAEAVKALSEAEDSKMLFKAAGDGQPAAPQFTRTQKTGGNNGAVTKESIMATRDRGERLRLIAENKELFGIQS